MKKTWLWIILAIIILGLGVYFSIRIYHSQSTASPTPVIQPTQLNTVTIQNKVYNPSGINIKAGTTVTFINNDSTWHSITGADYDSGQIQPGKSVTHTFNTVGEFTYHCQNYPSMTLTISVK